MHRSSLTLLKGTLDILILRTLHRQPMHGYEVKQRISESSSDEFQVEEGVLYPALRRLENKGWLRAEWRETATGREARVYELTEIGQQMLTEQMGMWDRYVRAMEMVLQPGEVTP